MTNTLFDKPTEAPMSTALVEHRTPDAPAALISQAIAAGIPLGELREALELPPLDASQLLVELVSDSELITEEDDDG